MDFIRRSGYESYIEKSAELLRRFGEKILLPADLAWVEDGVRKECAVGAVPPHIGAVDIGSVTAKRYAKVIESSHTVFVNGPMRPG